MTTSHLFLSMLISIVGVILMFIDSLTKDDTGFLSGLVITLFGIFCLVVLAITITI